MDGWTLAGQQYDPRYNVAYRFTQKMLDYSGVETARVTGSEGNAATDLSPVDRMAAQARIYDVSSIQTALGAVFNQRAAKIRVDDIPIVLTGITVVFTKATGTGTDTHPASQQSSQILFGSGNASLSPKASSTGSATVQVSVAPVFKRPPAKVSGTECELFLQGDFDENDILAALSAGTGSTVLAWPTFAEKSETLVLSGMQISLTAKADSQVSMDVRRDVVQQIAWEYGKGTSQEVQVSNTIVQIPPCIHDAINIDISSDTALATASADASTAALQYTSGTAGGGAVAGVDAITNTTGTLSKTATANVTPTSLPATGANHSIPTSGLYLYDYKIDSSVGYGMTRIVAEVINASVFA